MTRIILTWLLFTTTVTGFSQQKNRFFKGMYIQWGYNVESYTKSNIHFKMGNGNNFVLHHAVAHDKGDFDAIYKEPSQISIPQYNYRFGFYLNKTHTRAFELNFDHAKYVVTDGQKVRVTGTIDGVNVNGDSILSPNNFLHFEHTDGANWLHFNYVQQHTVVNVKNNSKPLLTFLWKAGAGINIPRTDFTWRGDRFNNDFHVAGYNISVEAGARLYFLPKFFVELTGKTGFVKYINALSNSNQIKGNRVTHSFGFVEGIATLGYDIKFR
jgi:hypothetical protein